MKVTFKHDLEKDVWCLLAKGKSSINFPTPTKIYSELEKEFGENPTEDNTKIFIKNFIHENNIDIDNNLKIFQRDWDSISDEFQKRAERIFGLSLADDATAYLTINDRCPYKIKENLFFVRIKEKLLVRKTTMHELWHFYTWYKFGVVWENKIGKERYNDVKESLTILLNIECADLLPEGIVDKGYPQHKELREEILKLWGETGDIGKVWKHLI